MDNNTINRIMRGCKVILCPTLTLAQEEAEKHTTRLATVEAEYGSIEVSGTDDMGAWKKNGHHINPENLPPCIKNKEGYGNVSPVIPEYIIVSHLDLDALGGIGLLLGYFNPEEQEFWEAAAYIDCNGPHHILKVPEKAQKQLRAFWAYNEYHRPPQFPRDSVSDVTDMVAEYFTLLDKIAHMDSEVISAGEAWENKKSEETENSLVYESENIRGFAGPYFTASAYCGKDGLVRQCTISFSTKKKSITLAFEDGGKKHNAAEIMRSLFGAGAGGHAGIAGTPRGGVYNVFDLCKVIEHVEVLLSK